MVLQNSPVEFCCLLPINSRSRGLVKKERSLLFKSYTILEGQLASSSKPISFITSPLFTRSFKMCLEFFSHLKLPALGILRWLWHDYSGGLAGSLSVWLQASLLSPRAPVPYPQPASNPQCTDLSFSQCPLAQSLCPLPPGGGLPVHPSAWPSLTFAVQRQSTGLLLLLLRVWGLGPRVRGLLPSH